MVATLFARRWGVAATLGRAPLARAAVDDHLAVGLAGQGLAEPALGALRTARCVSSLYV